MSKRISFVSSGLEQISMNFFQRQIWSVYKSDFGLQPYYNICFLISPRQNEPDICPNIFYIPCFAVRRNSVDTF